MSAKQVTGYTQPEIPKSGYSFVAAAALAQNYAGITVYVKYKGADAHKITVKDASQNHLWLICPDRELVIVRNSYATGAFYPSGDSFDEVHDFNLFNDAVSKDLGIEYIMTNYAHTGSEEQHPRLKAVLPPEKRIQVLSDSGGLQMARGMTSSIHPADLIDFYNHNVDAGMCLDVPLYVRDIKTLERAARLQRENTDIMLEMSKGTELLNIFHGSSIEERMRFREIVEDDRVNRVAMSTLYRQTLPTAVNDIYHTVYGSKKRYKQYHALGIYVSSYIPLLVKIANSGENPPHITSDSTSHIQSARNKSYHFQFDMMHTQKRLAIGSRASVPNTQKILPCQCHVCRVLKYTDVLAFGPMRYVMELLSTHNAIEMTRYAKQLQEAAQQLPAREFNKIVEMQLKTNPELKHAKMAMDFVDIASQEGVEVARKKYSNFINVPRAPAINKSVTLFGGDDVDENIAKHEHAQKVLGQMEKSLKVWRKTGKRIKYRGDEVVQINPKEDRKEEVKAKKKAQAKNVKIVKKLAAKASKRLREEVDAKIAKGVKGKKKKSKSKK